MNMLLKKYLPAPAGVFFSGGVSLVAVVFVIFLACAGVFPVCRKMFVVSEGESMIGGKNVGRVSVMAVVGVTVLGLLTACGGGEESQFEKEAASKERVDSRITGKSIDEKTGADDDSGSGGAGIDKAREGASTNIVAAARTFSVRPKYPTEYTLDAVNNGDIYRYTEQLLGAPVFYNTHEFGATVREAIEKQPPERIAETLRVLEEANTFNLKTSNYDTLTDAEKIIFLTDMGSFQYGMSFAGKMDNIHTDMSKTSLDNGDLLVPAGAILYEQDGKQYNMNDFILRMFNDNGVWKLDALDYINVRENTGGDKPVVPEPPAPPA